MTDHEALMRPAIAEAATARLRARPNPWVGAVVVCVDGSMFSGATEEPIHFGGAADSVKF